MGSVKAWNGYGHSCAAYIAEQHLTPEAKVSVGETIDEYIANAKTEDDIAVLEAYKIFVGIIND